MKKLNRDGFVYFIENKQKSAIKIGYSNNPVKRLKQLQTGNSDKLRLVYFFTGNKDNEFFMHKRFEEFRIKGEWFESEPVLKWIRMQKIQVEYISKYKI